MTENRYDLQSSYTAAGRGVRVEGGHIQRIAESTLAPAPTNGEIDGAALRSLETVSEKSTPIDRAWGVAIKSIVIVLVTLWATYALGRAGATGLQTGLFFALVTLGAVSVAASAQSTDRLSKEIARIEPASGGQLGVFFVGWPGDVGRQRRGQGGYGERVNESDFDDSFRPFTREQHPGAGPCGQPAQSAWD